MGNTTIQQKVIKPRGTTQGKDKQEIPFSSNAIRLSLREWAVTAVIVAVLFVGIPRGWQRIESYGPDSKSPRMTSENYDESSYRMPYELGYDYWLYERYCRSEAAKDKIYVIGDSVIWGQYVRKDQTLPAFLNQLSGKARYANMGVDGSHPVALEGMIRYYSGAIRNKDVVLLLNPLWMSSLKADLQTTKEYRFNHPRLVPQFYPIIPCYAETPSKRISIALEHRIPLFNWSNHIQVAYFENCDIPTWSIEHPYANFVKNITLQIPEPDNKILHEPMSWIERGLTAQNMEWVDLATSLQWNAFQRLVKVLQQRGNRLFVIVGPFNEYMLLENSRELYRKMKDGIAQWLRQQNITSYIPGPLPSELYADASHPGAEGYRQIAEDLFRQEAFPK